MKNPLDTGDGGTTFQADLAPGETRTIHAKDRSGNIVKTITVHRTEREYVFDLCDAYNAARSEDARQRGLEWYVAPNGELKLGDNAAWSKRNAERIESRNETERARHNRLMLEHARRDNAFQPEDA